MEKLYEVSQAYADFYEALEAGEIPDEAVEDTLAGLDGMLDEKADNIACIIKQLDAETDAIKNEEVRLKDRRQAKENRRKRLREYLQRELLVAGKIKIETPRNRISFRKSMALEVINESELINELAALNFGLRYKTEIDKTAVTNALKSGDQINNCKLVERQNIQIK